MPGLLVRRLHQIHASLFAEAMRGAGTDLTPPQFGTLAVLEDRPGIDQATLAGLVALDRPTTGGVVERLESKGLLLRAASAKDRRSKVLRLTAEGVATLTRLRPLVRGLQEEFLDGLTARERRQFEALAAKAADAANGRSRAPLVLPGAADPRPGHVPKAGR
ncbi:MAG: MarR family transcriptional regulator [Pseudomonadota bacterium]